MSAECAQMAAATLGYKPARLSMIVAELKRGDARIKAIAVGKIKYAGGYRAVEALTAELGKNRIA